MILHPFLAIGTPQGADWIILFVLVVLGPALWLGALLSCLRHEPSTGNTKIVWVLVVLLAFVVGPLLYLLVRRPQRIRDLGR